MQKQETKKTEAVETTEVVETVEEKEVAEAVVASPEKEELSHRAKRYLRVIAIFVVFFLGGSIIGSIISELFTFDKAQQDLLKAEIAEIGVLTNAENYDYEALNAMLDETVTSDEYIPLEKALKSFTKDVVAVTATVDEATSSSVLEHALTAQNISADGPDFTNTLAELDAVYTTLTEARAQFVSLMTEEKVLSYLPEDTEDELVEVYTEIVSGIKMTSTDARYIAMIDRIDKTLAMIDAEKAAINYLIENQSDWKVKDGFIYFDKEEQVREYNALLEAVTKAVQ